MALSLLLPAAVHATKGLSSSTARRDSPRSVPPARRLCTRLLAASPRVDGPSARACQGLVSAWRKSISNSTGLISTRFRIGRALGPRWELESKDTAEKWRSIERRDLGKRRRAGLRPASSHRDGEAPRPLLWPWKLPRQRPRPQFLDWKPDRRSPRPLGRAVDRSGIPGRPGTSAQIASKPRARDRWRGSPSSPFRRRPFRRWLPQVSAGRGYTGSAQLVWSHGDPCVAHSVRLSPERALGSFDDQFVLPMLARSDRRGPLDLDPLLRATQRSGSRG
jgi:hypothetical protein